MNQIGISGFTLDLDGPELRRDGVPVAVQPLVLAVLRHLASHPDRLVTKAELAAAVWKTQDVSDEVLARAVMKARRALGEDARAPVHILTEAGKGFRFQGAVSQPPAAAPHDAPASLHATEAPSAATSAWRVLRFVNRGEDPALDWAVTGLQRLLCHTLESSSPGVVATAEPNSGARASDQGTPSNRIARGVASSPGDRWVACEVDHADSGHRLDMAWAVPGERASALSLTGTSLPALVQRAADQLQPAAPWQRDMARSHPQVWAQLNETISHLHRWPRAEAVQRLQGLMARLPAHPRLLLQQAELLVTLVALDEAGEAALAAQRMLDVDPEPHVLEQVRVHWVLAELAKRRARLPLVQEHAQAGLALAASAPPGAVARDVVRLWLQVAYVRMESGELPQAAAAYEQATRQALRGGLANLELVARLNLANVLRTDGQVHRAEELVRQAVDRALELGQRERAGWATGLRASMAEQLGRHAVAVRQAERAMAQVIPADTDNLNLGHTRMVLTQALISAGRLDRAERMVRLQQQVYPAGGSLMLHLQNPLAWLRWRQGRLDEAEDCYRRLLADPRVAALEKWANFLRSEHAQVLALLGRSDEGRATLATLSVISLPMVVGRGQAALDMAEGRRDAARERLAGLLSQASPGRYDAHRLLLDLAWLCLEDGHAAQAEDLLDQVVVMDTDAVERRWVELWLRDRLQPVDPAEWEALRADSPSLVRHCPWLGTPDDVQQRRSGPARRLPNLLSVLTW